MEERTNWDFNGLFRSILLAGFSTFFLWMLISGNIKHYLSIRLLPFPYFATFTFLILTFVQLRRSMPKMSKEESCNCGIHHGVIDSRFKKITTYTTLILPLALGVIIPYQVPGSALAEKKGIQIGTQPYTQSATTTQSNANDSQDADPYRNEALQLKKKDKIIVNDDNYFVVLAILDMYQNEFIGKKIEIKGMLYHDPDIKGEKALGRVLITCCFADATFYGIPIIGNNVKSYKTDSWVSIEGTIGETKANGTIVACIKPKKAKKTSAPKDPYIYPD